MATMRVDPAAAVGGPARRAIYYPPSEAFARGGGPVPVHVFDAELRRAAAPETPTGFVPLDLSATLGLGFPATTPALLARYVVLRPGEPFEYRLAATGEVYYVIAGAGSTSCDAERIDWCAGDAFCLPGATPTRHVAEAGGALLLVATNEPELAYLGAEPAANRHRIPPTHYTRARIEAELELVHARQGPQRSAGQCVVFVTTPMAELRLATPTLLASINTLEPGADQRPHRHNSAALTLSIAGAGTFSRIDGKRVEWHDGVVVLTPPGAVHSHHNRGSRRMLSFVVQDTGLHTHLRTTEFRWADEPS